MRSEAVAESKLEMSPEWDRPRSWNSLSIQLLEKMRTGSIFERIYLNWGAFVNDIESRLRYFPDHLNLCFDLPILSRPENGPRGLDDEVVSYYSIATFDPHSLSGGFRIPPRPTNRRLEKIIREIGVELRLGATVRSVKSACYVLHVEEFWQPEIASFVREVSSELYFLRKLKINVVVVLQRGSRYNHLKCEIASEDLVARLAYLARSMGFYFYDSVQPIADVVETFDLIVTNAPNIATYALLRGVRTICTHPRSVLSLDLPTSVSSIDLGWDGLDDVQRIDVLSRISYTQWSSIEIEDGSMLEHYLPLLEAETMSRRRHVSFISSDEPITKIRPSLTELNICGRILQFDPSYRTEREFINWWLKGRENPSRIAGAWLISHIVSFSDCVVDVGAGIGFSALLHLASGADEVIAIEADSNLFKRLAAIEHHGLQVHHLGLTNEAGESELYTDLSDSQSSTFHIEQIRRPSDSSAIAKKLVKTVRADTVLQAVEFSVLHVDTNGDEIRVIEGFGDWSLSFQATPRCVMVRASPNSLEELINKLGNIYRHVAVVEARCDGKCRLLQIKEGMPTPGYVSTFIFINSDIDSQLFDWCVMHPPKSHGGVN